MVAHGDPGKFWNKVESFFIQCETTFSPVRWKPWRDLFWDREGVYVTIRCVIFLLALAGVSLCSHWVVRVLAVGFTIFFILDILLIHTSLGFVRHKPQNILRSAVLAFFSFVQLPVGFAVFYRCIPDSFVPSLNAMRAVYFSFVTITTVGYGDIQPKASDWLSQALILVELIVGIFFIAVLIARITSHVVIGKPPEGATGK